MGADANTHQLRQQEQGGVFAGIPPGFFAPVPAPGASGPSYPPRNRQRRVLEAPTGAQVIILAGVRSAIGGFTVSMEPSWSAIVTGHRPIMIICGEFAERCQLPRAQCGFSAAR